VVEVAVELLPELYMLQQHMEQSCTIKPRSMELQQCQAGVQRPLVPEGGGSDTSAPALSLPHTKDGDGAGHHTRARLGG